ncbi:ATP-binding protein [Autumnicola edwardsiae]|uniref:ATP-binding protein n=1 Tax=Autumnicola edwardsiae TaxID=3075594 RepID=A0ABU3CW41_9FLAO|nr:ATP-binding protein [Zunongwangia sp. F297]MDT0650582.1 ATP-binding protein [Zunongwangia sp. F297]
MQFRTKARAVDLLGKGQIADLPTAITELWKNGYDAYADNLTAEIFKKSFTGLDKDLFLLTDDGKGMSQKDIFDKWLVLGTDSKSRAQLEKSPDIETLWKKPRVKAGEKGIGRLSVAFLGQPMLMLTKKIGSPIQMLFFNWNLLENYNLYLDDIHIPVKSLEDKNEFQDTFENLKASFLENLDKKEDFEGKLIWEESQKNLKKQIIESVNNSVVSNNLMDALMDDFTDLKESHGTKFLIFNPIDQILDLSEVNSEDNRDNRDFIISSLSGFFNPFIKKEKKAVKTYFYIHNELGKDKDLLVEEGNFFTSEDYNFADILIEGKFTGYGKFNGTLKIYDKQIPYEFEPNRKKFKRKYYGDFYLKLGYSQGNLRDSKLNETAWKRINNKVETHGGLYLYRDNFRVLPYGRPNADFLKFEERRNKRISTYYFSYRRMFGYIGLTRENNSDLKDKSSREGLINNDPYSAFESDLIAFFVQIAKDYLSDTTDDTIFQNEKKKLNEQHQAITDDRKREIEEKKAFSKSLTSYPKKFAEYEKEYKKLMSELENKISSTKTTYSDIEQILNRLSELDIEFEELLPDIPKRYKPTDLQLDRLNRYEDQILNFNETIKQDSSHLLDQVNEKLELEELKINFSKSAEVYKEELNSILNTHRNNLQDKFRSLIDEYNQRAQTLLDDFNHQKNHSKKKIKVKKDIKEQSDILRQQFDRLRKRANTTLVPLSNHIQKMTFEIDEELLQGAYKAQYDQMLQQWSLVQDTAQLGIAVEIIDHEFNVLYSRINRLMDELNTESNVSNNKKFNLLEKAFRSLEDKYDLLSPLYRINAAVDKEIKLNGLANYINQFFGKQLAKEGIEVTASDEFLKQSIIIKEPVLYTVTINLINNAIYWVRNSDKKEIRLDYFKETNEILILNSGKKIEEHRLPKIFDLFYSNRPSGRGIGLYLAKQTLNENYFDIEATNIPEYNYLNGACFVIKSLSAENE